MLNNKSKLVRLTDIPQSSAGAPIPFVIADEHRLAVFYYAERTEPEWDGKSMRSVGKDSAGEEVVMVRFKTIYVHQFGPPNDEAIHGHPLFELGLEPYSSFEVRNSAWIGEFCKRNSVHSNHKDSHFSAYRHLILTFHDTTIEVIAEDYEAKIVGESSLRNAAKRYLAEWMDE